MWAEAMRKLEGMDSTNRERLWPELVKGFKDLSNRLKVLVLCFLSKVGFLTLDTSSMNKSSLSWLARLLRFMFALVGIYNCNFFIGL